MNRRKFIKNSFIIAGGLTISQTIQGCKSYTGSGKKLFSFVQINDIHLSSPENKETKSLTKLFSVISSINLEKNFPLPDFVLVVGDFINGSGLNLLQPECEYARKILDELKCPYYTVVGNHEVLNTEDNPRFLNAYVRTFGQDRVNYSFVHKGFQFILFDDSNGLGTGNDATFLRNEWLINTLKANENYPKFIICHIPLVALRDDKVLDKSFGYWTYKLRGDDTFRIIENYSDTVIAVLNGHVHLTGMTKTNNYWLSFLFPGENDIYHIAPSGLASYPCHYAHYTVYENRIDVRMIQVARDLVTPLSNIHGKQFHNQEFLDSGHKSPDAYVCGNKDENIFSIPLPKRKGPVT